LQIGLSLGKKKVFKKSTGLAYCMTVLHLQIQF
jgi:hypothetical protein